MMYATPGQYGGHGSGISVDRSAAMVTGAVDTYGQVPFDTVNDAVTATNAALVSGDVVVESEWYYCVTAQAQVEYVAGLTGIGVRLLRDGVVVGGSEQREITVAAGGMLVASVTALLYLQSPSVISLEVASFGSGGTPIATGRSATFLSVEAI